MAKTTTVKYIYGKGMWFTLVIRLVYTAAHNIPAKKIFTTGDTEAKWPSLQSVSSSYTKPSIYNPGNS